MIAALQGGWGGLLRWAANFSGMNDTQLAHYRTLPSFEAKADYLVRIGDARDFSEACRLMNQRRRRFAMDRKAHAAERQTELEKRARMANPYAGLD